MQHQQRMVVRCSFTGDVRMDVEGIGLALPLLALANGMAMEMDRQTERGGGGGDEESVYTSSSFLKCSFLLSAKSAEE